MREATTLQCCSSLTICIADAHDAVSKIVAMVAGSRLRHGNLASRLMAVHWILFLMVSSTPSRQSIASKQNFGPRLIGRFLPVRTDRNWPIAVKDRHLCKAQSVVVCRLTPKSYDTFKADSLPEKKVSHASCLAVPTDRLAELTPIANGFRQSVSAWLSTNCAASSA